MILVEAEQKRAPDWLKEPYPLSGEIKVYKKPPESLHYRPTPTVNLNLGQIYVGNSGLIVEVEQTFCGDFVWRQHYSPDNESSAIPGQQIKYSAIYVFALNQLLCWWQDLGNFEDEFPPRVNFLFGETNGRMNTFREKLLGEEVYLSRPVDGFYGLYQYQLFLDQLSNNPQALLKVKKISRWCKRQGYKMVKPPPF